MRRLLLAAALLVLAACAPAVTSVVSPPSFRVVPDGTSLLRLEPPGIGSGSAVFRIELEATNPNPFPLDVAGLDGDFYLGGTHVAGTAFRDGIALPARGTGRLTLDVEVPLEGGAQAVAQLARLVASEAVAYRLDAGVSAVLLGSTQRFPTLTVAQGEMRFPGGLRPPTVRLVPQDTAVRISGLNAVVEVGLEIDNPLPLGYYVSAPRVDLLLDGRVVGSAGVPTTPVAASGTSQSLLRFEFGLPQAGAALIARLQGGGRGVALGLNGAFSVEIPGIASTTGSLASVSGHLP